MAKQKKPISISNPIDALDVNKLTPEQLKGVVLGGRGLDHTGATDLGRLTYNNAAEYGSLIEDEDGRITADPKDWQNLASENQWAGTQVAKGLGRTLMSTGLKLGQGVGLLGSAIAVLGNEGYQAATGGEGSEDVWGAITDNHFVNGLFKAEEVVKNSDALKIFKPSDWDNKNIFQQMGSTAWWADEMADGAAFALSSYGVAGLAGKVNVGGRLSAVLRGSGSTTKALNTIVGEAAAQTTKMGAMARSSSLMRTLVNNAAKGVGGAVDFATQVGVMTANEALFEARDTGHQIQSKLLKEAGYEDASYMDAEDQRAFIQGLPEEERTKILNNKGEAMKNTFMGNMAAITASNAFELIGLNKLMGKSFRKMMGMPEKSIIGAGGNILDDVQDLGKGAKRFLGKGSRSRALLTAIPAHMASEGLYEENIQNAIQNVSLNFEGEGAVDYMKQVADDMFTNTFKGDKDTWKSIMTGAVLGGLMGGFSANSEYNVKKERQKELVEKLNQTRDNFVNMLGHQIYKKNEDGSIALDEGGNPVYDEDFLMSFTSNQEQAKDLIDLQDLYQRAGNEDVANIFRNEAYTKLATAYLEAGLGNELIERIEALKNVDTKTLNELGLSQFTAENDSNNTPTEFALKFLETAKAVKNDYDAIRREMPNADLNSYAVNTATKIASRLRSMNDNIDGLSARIEDLKGSYGNPLLNDINAKTLRVKYLKESLKDIDPIKYPKSYKQAENVIRLEEEALNKLKEDKREGFFESDLILLPESLSYVKEQSPKVAEKSELIRNVKKQAEYELAILQQTERFNNIMERPEIVSLEMAERMFQYAQENQDNVTKEEVIRELQAGQAVEVINKETKEKEVHSVTVNPQTGKLSFENGTPIDNNLVEAYSAIRVLGQDEVINYVEEQKQTFREKQLRERIRRIGNNLIRLKQRHQKAIKELESYLPDLQLLQKRREKAKDVVSEKILDARIRRIEALMTTTQEQIQVLEDSIRTRYELMDDINESINVGGLETDVEVLQEEVNALREQAIEGEILLEQEQGFLEKLKEHYNFAKEYWTKLFPNKRRVFKDYNEAIEAIESDEGQRILDRVSNMYETIDSTLEEDIGILEEIKSDIDKGDEYSGVKQEVAVAKEDVARQEQLVKDLQLESTRQQKKADYFEKELKDYKAFLDILLNPGIVFPESGLQSDLLPPTPSNGTFKLTTSFKDGGPKKDIGSGLFSTTGNPNRNTPEMNAWYKFTEQVDSKNYELMAVTIDHPLFGLGGKYDLYSSEPKQYQNKNNVKVVAINKVEKNSEVLPYRVNGVIPATSLIEPKDRVEDYTVTFDGVTSPMFTNKQNLSPEQLNQINENYKNFIESIKSNKDGVKLTIESKSLGFINKGNGNAISGRQAFGSKLPIINIVDKDRFELRGQEMEVDLGTPFVYHPTAKTPIPGQVRNINRAEAEAVLPHLKDYAKLTIAERLSDKGKAIRDRIDSILFLGKANLPQHNTLFQKGANTFIFGTKRISSADLLSGQYDSDIIEHIMKQRHQVSNKHLKKKGKFTSIFGVEYNNYNEYLMSDNSRSPKDIPVKFEIVPSPANYIEREPNESDSSFEKRRSALNETRQVNGIYLNFNTTGETFLKNRFKAQTKVVNTPTNGIVLDFDRADDVLAEANAGASRPTNKPKVSAEEKASLLAELNGGPVAVPAGILSQLSSSNEGNEGAVEGTPEGTKSNAPLESIESFTPTDEIPEGQPNFLEGGEDLMESFTGGGFASADDLFGFTKAEPSAIDLNDVDIVIADNPFADVLPQDITAPTDAESSFDLSDFGIAPAKPSEADKAEFKKKKSKGGQYLEAERVKIYKQGNLQKEIKILEDLVGKEAFADFVTGLINGIGYGQTLMDGRILLSDMLTEGTAYHEAFHRVFSGILDSSTRSAIIQDWRNRNPLTEDTKSDLQVEEELAEEFREYMLSKVAPHKGLKGLFNRIVRYFKSLFRIPSAVKQSFFEKLGNGYYKGKPVSQDLIQERWSRANGYGLISGKFGTATERDFFEHMSSNFLIRLRQVGFNTSDINSQQNQLGSIYEQVLRDTLHTLVRNNPNNPNASKVLAQYINQNGLDVIEDFKNYMKRFNIVSQEQVEENLQLEEDERSKDTLGIIDAVEFDPKAGMSHAIKLLIASLPAMRYNPKTRKKEVILNSLNLPKTSDYKLNLAILHNSLAETDSIQEMRDVINRLSLQKPEYSLMLQFLKIPTEGEVTTVDMSQSDVMFQNKFKQQFDKAHYDYFTQLYYEDGSTNLVNANNDRAESLTRAKWSSNFIYIPASNKTISSEGVEIFNGKKIAEKYKAITHDNVLAFYEDLGIVFSNPNSVNLDVLVDNSSKILNKIIKEDINDLFANETDLRGITNEIIQQEVNTSLNTGDNQHINPEGKTVYSISLNNMLTLAARKINKGIASFLQWNGKDATGNFFARNSVFLNSGYNIKVNILEGVNSEFENTNAITSKLSRTDTSLFHFTSIMDKGIYPFLRQGDRKIEYGISLQNENGLPLRPEDLGFNQINKVTEILKGYLADELLSAFELNVNGVGEDISTYSSVGKDLRIFNGIFNAALTKEYKALIEKKNTARQDTTKKAITKIDNFVNKPEVVEALQNFLLKKQEIVLNEFVKNRVIIRTSDGTYQNRLLPANRIPKEYLSKEAMLEQLMPFIAALTIGNIEQIKLFTGDTAFYKQKGNKVDFFKRTGGTGGTGKTLRNDQEYIDWANENAPRGDNKAYSNKLSLYIFNDNVTTSSLFNEYVKNLVDLGMPESQAKSILKPYREYDEADAQGYISIHAYRDVLMRSGDWLPQQEVIYNEKLVNGIPLTSEEALTFPPLKPQYFGPQDYNGIFVPTFYKLSVMPLIPSVVQGKQLDNLRKDMEANGIDIATFVSGNKVGTVSPSSFYKEDGNYNSEAKHITSVDFDFMKIQLDMSPEKHDKVTFGTQFRKLVLSNIFAKTLYGQDSTRLANKYTDLIKKQIEKEIEKWTNRLEVKQLPDGSYTLNKSVLSDILLDEAFRRNSPKNVIDDITEILHKDRNLEAMITRGKLESILMGMVNSGVIKNKVKGDMLVQGAISGFESKARKQSDVDAAWASDLDTLNFYRYGKNGTKAMEVYLPHRFKEYYGKDVDISTLDPRLTEIIGFRIPTQGLNSIEVIKIKGFLPQEAGNLVIVPSEIVAKAGSDFDIDKLTIFLPNYRVNYKKGLLQDFYKANPKVKQYLKTNSLNLRGIIESVEAGFNSSENDNIVYNIYEKFRRENQDNYVESVEYVEYTEENPSLDGIQNEIIRTAREIVLAPENFQDLIAPISAEKLSNEADVINGLRESTEGTTTRANYIDFDYLMETRESFLTGKEGVAIGALNLVHHVMSQQAQLSLSSDITSIELNHNSTENNDISLYGDKDANGENNILDIVSSFLNGFVDIAKDPFMKYINASTDTAGTYLYLIRAGVPLKEAVAFMNQPIILDYLNEIRLSNSISNKISNNGRGISRDRIAKKIGSMYAGTLEGEVDFSLSNLHRMIKEGNKTPNFGASQRTYLGAFLKYETAAGKLSDLMRATNADTAGAGNTIMMARDYMERYENVINEGYFNNVENFKNNTFLDVFTKAVDLSVKAYSPLFEILQSEELLEATAIVKKDILDRNPKTSKTKLEKVLKTMQNDFVGYLVQNAVNDRGLRLGSFIKQYFHGNKSVPKTIVAIKQQAEQEQLAIENGQGNSTKYIKIANNLLFREFHAILSKKQNDISTGESFDNLRIFSKRLPTEVANDLISAWEELFQLHPAFGKQLFEFALLQSSLNNSDIEFLKYAPTKYTAKILNDYIELGKNHINIKEFLDMFYRNNWNNPDLVPFVRMGRGEKKTVMEDGNILESDTNALYVKSGNKKQGYNLFRKVKTLSNGNTQFKFVPKLGNGKFFKEYVYGNSVVGNNNINLLSEQTTTNVKVPLKVKTFEDLKQDAVVKINTLDIAYKTKQRFIKQAQSATTNLQLSEILKQACSL